MGAIEMDANGEPAVPFAHATDRPVKLKSPLSGLDGPHFLVTVDTEEEFDWSGPFTRDRHGLTHLTGVERFQSMCRSRSVAPLYLVDFPITTDPFGAEYFGNLARNGEAEIGLQLHPWVTPPFDEVVNARNSYACNLSPQVERAKLELLHAAVVEKLGVQPDSYRAGRYGYGASTAAILRDLGIRFDTSIRSLFDYSGQGGPNYASMPLVPYWALPGELVELPLTTVFAGALKSFGVSLFENIFQSETMRATLARTGMLERIALTPEGIPLDKAIKAIDIALEMQLPLLVFSFHSPSLAVGHTPYVRSQQDLDLFYSWWEKVFDHLSMRNVKPATIGQLKSIAFA